MNATCFIETRSVFSQTQVCCNEKEIVEPPPKCSDPLLEDNGEQVYR